MAFVKINKSATGPFRLGVATIRMGSRLQSDKSPSRAIYFTLSRPVIDQVGWKPDETQERSTVSVAIHEGINTDAGFLLIEQDSTGYHLGASRSGQDTNAFSMNVATSRLRHYVINDPLIEKAVEEVEFTIDEEEHTILIQCPDWLRYNPSSVPEPKIVEQPPVVEDRKPTRPTRTIAKDIVDDIDVVTRKPDKLTLNREERRRLAKKVVSQLGH